MEETQDVLRKVVEEALTTKEVKPEHLIKLKNSILDALGYASTMVLTYDSTQENYEKGSFKKENVVKFLESKGAFKLNAITTTTIFFKTIENPPLEHWISIFAPFAKDNELEFTLSVIAKNGEGRTQIHDSEKRLT